MQYTPMIRKALILSFEAHKHQKDQSGVPYIFHPLHLAEQMETEDEICTALLHDVVEDSDWTLEDLHREGFPQNVCEALSAMTHDADTPYMTYILRLRSNPLAKKVKQADLIHNMDLSRLNQVTEYALRRQQKYRIALSILQDDPYDPVTHCFRKTIPLDNSSQLLLSVYYKKNTPDETARVLKYQILLYETNRCYELTSQDMLCLEEELRSELSITGQPLSLPELLSEFLKSYGLETFLTILERKSSICQ